MLPSEKVPAIVQEHPLPGRHPTVMVAMEPFGDPATSWLLGTMPAGWNLSEYVMINDPQAETTIRVNRADVNIAVDPLAFAQGQSDYHSALPGYVMFAGLIEVRVGGIEAPGYVAAFLIGARPGGGGDVVRLR